jgi:AbrB family looped-hinge helix DNA binding protein
MSTACTVRLSSKGQIVIPVTLRRRFGLKTGQLLVLRDREGEIALRPVERAHAELQAALKRARAWVRRSGRDLVEELHARRRAEHARDTRRR